MSGESLESFVIVDVFSTYSPLGGDREWEGRSLRRCSLGNWSSVEEV